MTPDQFAALAELLRLRGGPTKDAVKLALVDGLTVPDAAKAAGLEYRFAHRAIARARKGLALAERAVLEKKE